MNKYILKPGKHQFAPGSAAVHSNDTLTDEEAEWYLQHYPHIAGLFVAHPVKEVAATIAEPPKTKRPRIRKIETPGSEGSL